ncbi:MAG: hypothetical protein ACLSG5_12695 [Oscillospiraceae bacterium]
MKPLLRTVRNMALAWQFTPSKTRLSARQGKSSKVLRLYLVGYDPRTKKWIEAKPCNMCDRMIRNAGILRVVRREIDE